jgi:hypothetical protein
MNSTVFGNVCARHREAGKDFKTLEAVVYVADQNKKVRRSCLTFPSEHSNRIEGREWLTEN